MDGTQKLQTRLDQLIVGYSPMVCEMRRLIATVAAHNLPVMAHGPTGAGKELVAQGLHALSGRKGAFVAVNCAAIPADLLESELFGYERGAFTGADRRRPGRIEEASGGTLFLDEIGDMPLALQSKLLRVLESRRLRRVGSGDEILVDFRLVSATHQDIAALVEQRRFRADLLYRINVFPIQVPALADRREDIPDLVEKLGRDMEKRLPGLKRPAFAADGVRRLQAHDWPGNVRELRNFLERAAVLYPALELGAEEVARVLTGNEVRQKEEAFLWDAIAEMSAAEPGAREGAAPAPGRAETAPDRRAPLSVPDGDNDTGVSRGASQRARRAPPGPADFSDLFAHCSEIDLKGFLREIEMEIVLAALRQTEGRVSDAAHRLGLNRTTLFEKLKRFNIDPDSYRDGGA